MLKFYVLYIFLSFSTVVAHTQSIFVNEINYLGEGSSEGIGIAGPAGTIVDGWSLVFYNANGTVSHVQNLNTQTILDENNNSGEVWYDVAMANEPTAFAVVNSSGQLVQFLSYGAINSVNYQVLAIEGIANQTGSALSTWVGNALQNLSLQLIGEGNEYGDFDWLLPSGGLVSDGAINTGQTFNASLPIQLISFEVEASKSGHQLTWVTDSEIDNDFFVIERSVDGFRFEKLHQIESKSNGLQKVTYQYLDKYSTTTTAFYYRLQQVDKNGATQFSSIVFSAAPTSTIAIQTFPNPTIDELNISIPTLKNIRSIVHIINSSGQIVKSIRIDIIENFLTLDVQTLPNDRYFLQIQQDQQTYLGSFVKH